MNDAAVHISTLRLDQTSQRLYRNNYRGAWLRSGACAFMWIFALGAYLLNIIHTDNFMGVSATVIYIVIISFLMLLPLRKAANAFVKRYISISINILEIFGYTAIIYFMGGIRAVYLTPVYTLLIAYLATLGAKKFQYIIAGVCGGSLAFAVALEYFGIIPSLDPLGAPSMPGIDQFAIMTTLFVCLQISAFVSSTAGKIVKKSRRKLSEQNIALEEKTRSLEDAERELRKAHRQLEKRVEERTADLEKANTQLRAEIVDRKRAEEVSRENEARYRGLADSITEVFFAVDHDLKYTFWNKSSEELTGIAAADALGTSLYDLFPNIQGSLIERTYLNVLKTGHSKSIVVKYPVKGKEYWFDVSIYSSEGGLSVIAKDITYEKQGQEEKEKLQQWLIEANKIEAIATLAGGVAHQFNNCLATIVGNMDLISMKHHEGDNLAGRLVPMRAATQRMAQLTDQLLAYARGGKYYAKEMKLSDLVPDTLSIIGHTLKPTIDIETQLDHSVSPVVADNLQLQMALSAILTNASEAIEDKGRIRISCTNEMIPDQGEQIWDAVSVPYVCLTVQDSGKGMDEETRRRIFDPFFTTKAKGRGLGMAAVYGIVNNHGGWISVESELGKGTTVRIYLPAAGKYEAESVKAEAKTAGSQKTVLTIDDEPAVLDVTSGLLEKRGYRVLKASTGVEALAVVESYGEQIDVALLDLILPDMSGEELYPLLMQARPDLKVIVCSGYSIDGQAQEVLNAGAEGFLQKPITWKELSMKLEEILADS